MAIEHMAETTLPSGLAIPRPLTEAERGAVEQAGVTVERPPDVELPPIIRERSLFDQTQWRIFRFSQVPAGEDPAATQSRQERLTAAEQERVRLLEQLNREGLFNEAKGDLYDILETLRNHLTWRELIIEGGLGRNVRAISKEEHEAGHFWDDVRRIELMPAARNAVNFFYEGSAKLIEHMLRNPPDPNRPDTFQLPDDPAARLVARLWDFPTARERVEGARRRQRLYKRTGAAYYEMYEFLVHHPNELSRAQEEFIEDSATSFGGSTLDKMHSQLQSRAEVMDRMFSEMMNVFNITMEDEAFKQLRSAGHAKYNVLGSAFFGGKGRIGASAFFHYLEGLMQSVDNKPEFSNSIESLLFDEEGLNYAALELMTANDGAFIRQGITQEDPVGLKGERKRFEARSLSDMQEKLAKRKLKRFEGLVDHPAFQRLRAKLDQTDGGLVGQTAQKTQDTTYLTSWEIYSKLASGGFLPDELAALHPDMRQRVEDFNYKPKHKLARRLSEQEFSDMYEDLTPEELADEEFMVERRTKARNALRWAERINRTFLVDSRFASPRLKLENGENKPVILEIRDLLKILIDNDSQLFPPTEQLFKISNLFRKLGMDLTLPIYGSFHLGADDQERQDAVRKLIEQEPELNSLLQNWMSEGRRDRDLIMRWLEEERRVIRLVERFVRYKNDNYRDDPEKSKTVEGVGVKGYFNFKGGVKDWKNLIFGPWGISTSSVKVKELVKAADFYIRDFLYNFGCWTWREFVPYLERDDEVQYFEEGPLFSEPLDAVFWKQVLERALNARSLWTAKAGKDGKPPGVLQGGPIAGAWTIRPVIYPHISPQGAPDKYDVGKDKLPKNFITLTPEEFDEKALTDTRAEFIKTTANIAANTQNIMSDKEYLETIFSEGPGTQLFENTLLAHDVLFWMATSPEYSEPFGYADQARSPAARKYYKTVWKESGLTYKEDQWEEIITKLTKAIIDRGIDLPDMLEAEEHAEEQFLEVFRSNDPSADAQYLSNRLKRLSTMPRIPRL